VARRHVLVLGGTGFVGRHLVAQLLAEGDRVTVLSRGVDPHKKRLLSREASIIEGDVGHPDFLRAVLDDVDAVANLIGILNERGDSGAGFAHVHVELLETLIQAMREMGVARLLQMSELNAGTGHSHYLESRGRAEQALRASKLDWTLFRPSVIAGPGDGLFCRFDALLRYAPLLPLGRASARFQPVWVGDVVQAFAKALADPAHIGRSYNLVGPEVMTLAEIVRAGARARGRLRGVLPLPDALGRLQAEIGEHLPGKPISRDNWRSLQTDSTSVENGLLKLGIAPTPVRSRLPEILAACPGRASP
jgi:uncharacterized protein YbjT (DUF2867 family)